MLEKKKVAPHERISLSSIVRYEDGEIVMPLRDVCKKEVVLLGGIKADVTISYVMSSRSNGYRAYRKARAYVGVKNESLAENLVNRRNRPVVEYKKIVQQVLWSLGMETTFSWNQRAGCSCPCVWQGLHLRLNLQNQQLQLRPKNRLPRPNATKPKQKPKRRPQMIQHTKLKDALEDQAFLNWINKQYPSR